MKSGTQQFIPSLAKRVIGIVAITLLAAGGAFVFIAHQTGYKILRDQAHEKAHGISEVGKNMLSFVMLEGRCERLKGTLDAINSARQVRDLLILRQDGSVYMQLDSQSVVDRLPLEKLEPLEVCPIEKLLTVAEKGEVYDYLVSSLPNRPECSACHAAGDSVRGYFAAKISMTDVTATSSRHRTTNILMAVGVFLGVGVAIVFALLVFVIRPVARLRDQMRNVSAEIDAAGTGGPVRLSELPASKRQDEIGELMATYNKLVLRLNEAYAKLHDLHQEQLEQADRLATTGEMAASIAHEIRNPVAGVLGALQVMLDELEPDDSRKEILDEMKLQVERVNQAVTDLLAYARPTPPVFEATSLSDIITRTSSMLARQMHNSGIDIIHVLEPAPVMLVGDRKQLQQVLWNIMLNGMQAMGSGGALTVSLERHEPFAIITIADTGGGIAPDQIERIFKPFFTTKHKGTGLGMTISKRIVEQHGGSLALVSRPGEGTSVTIQLPLKQNS